MYYSLYFVHYSYELWTSLEVDLSKELAAPVNHNVDKQVEAETDVRDLSLLFIFTWLLYHCGLMTCDISRVLLYSLPIEFCFGEKQYIISWNVPLHDSFEMMIRGLEIIG